MKELIKRWLEIDKVWEAMYDQDDIMEGFRDKLETIEDRYVFHIESLHNIPLPPLDPALFDPKSEPYPDELGGMKLGFATVTEECCLWAVRDNVLYAYEGEGNNTEARRIMVNPTRKAVAVNRKGTDYHFSEELRPFEFDGGIRAFEVCPLQTIDGKDLFAGLYLLVSDVKDAWV